MLLRVLGLGVNRMIRRVLWGGGVKTASIIFQIFFHSDILLNGFEFCAYFQYQAGQQ